jgi:L-asparaginase
MDLEEDCTVMRIFVTGGTFDKEYNELDGKLFFKDTHLHEMLELGRCKVNLDIRTLMMVDSLEMTDSDRQIILDHCKRAKEKRRSLSHTARTRWR